MYPKRWLLTDFGFSSIIPSGKVGLSNGRRGTSGYRAPEFLKEGAKPAEYTTSADIWSIGCILFELATVKGRTAFGWEDWPVVCFAKGLSPVPQLTVQDNALLQVETFSPAASATLTILQQLNLILQLCFALDPKERINAFELKARFEQMKVFLCQERRGGPSDGR